MVPPATLMQQRTQRPVQFEITEQTRQSVAVWISARGLKPADYLFPSRLHASPYLSTRRYAHGRRARNGGVNRSLIRSRPVRGRVSANSSRSTCLPKSSTIPGGRQLAAVIDALQITTFDGSELLVLIWALTRKSLDGRGASEGTTKKVEIEQLNDGSFLLMRYESVEASFSSSDHWYISLEEAYDECERVYGVGHDDWLQR